MTALYSINLRIMGRPNVAMLTETTVFTPLEILLENHTLAVMVCSIFSIIVVAGLLFWLLRSEFGLGIRATGANPIMAQAQGVKTNTMILFGIALSNGIIAISGSLFSQSQHLASLVKYLRQ